MALFNISLWQRSRFTLQWLIINLVGSLACLTAVALAQFDWSEGVSGSVSIPDVAFTSLGNLAVFMTAFTRGRLDVENGARDVLATTRGPNLNVLINGRGLTTRPPNDPRDVDVVLLSKYNERPHSSLTQFMQYISHSHALESILLQFLPFENAFENAKVTAEKCKCIQSPKCQCVVFWATEDIMKMLADRLPGKSKRLSESQWLLPSLLCLENECHRRNEGDVEAASESLELGTSELREGNPRVDSPAAIREALNESLIEKEESSCICIPVHPGNADRWTKFLIKFLKSKEKEAKGIKVVVSDALQRYITHDAQELGLLSQELGLLFQTLTGCIVASETYNSASLILPRVAEVIVNMGLTGWLRVDGFSSSLVARRAMRDHVVDSTGTGIGANAFLTEAVVFGSADATNVCQVLWFRSGILSARRVSYMVGCVNLICSITWSVLIACEGNWAPSTPLSTRRLAVIIGAVGVALGMDCFELYGGKVRPLFWARADRRARRRIDASLAREIARALPEVEARALPEEEEARARALAEAEAEARARAPAVARARARFFAEARALAEARVRVRARAPAEARARAPAEEEAEAQARAPAEEEVWAQARARPLAQFPDLALAQMRACADAEAREQAWAWAWVWGLVAVVILEVGCIVSLVVSLSMKKGLGRWVYSGMQVLVWVKWGIGSFLLGDNATEGEDGSPYFRRRNRGRWVYCSAFLLNAMLAGVRRKWVYYLNL